MAFLIRELDNTGGYGNPPSHEVYGSKTGNVYFTGTVEDCKKDISRRMRNYRAKVSRRAMKDAMDSVGLVRVRGALGGVYYE